MEINFIVGRVRMMMMLGDEPELVQTVVHFIIRVRRVQTALRVKSGIVQIGADNPVQIMIVLDHQYINHIVLFSLFISRSPADHAGDDRQTVLYLS